MVIIASNEGIERQVEHIEHTNGHQSELMGHPALRVAIPLFVRPLGDIDCLVSDAFEVRDEPQGRGKETQVVRDWLSERQHPEDERVDLNLIAVNLNVERDHILHDVLRTFKEPVEREPNDSLATNAHCEDVRS